MGLELFVNIKPEELYTATCKSGIFLERSASVIFFFYEFFLKREGEKEGRASVAKSLQKNSVAEDKKRSPSNFQFFREFGLKKNTIFVCVNLKMIIYLVLTQN
jgi:hypothetical protein